MNPGKRLISGGRVFTADPQRPFADTLLIDGDRIARVGGNEIIRDCTGMDIEHLDIETSTQRKTGALVGDDTGK